MNTSDLPGDLTGGNPLFAWLMRLKRAVSRRTLLPGLGYKLRQHENGVALEIIPGGGGTSVPGGGMNWRGEFTLVPVAPYNLFDVVKISTGPAAGVYIAVINNPQEEPDTGIGWVQIAPGNSSGDWN